MKLSLLLSLLLCYPLLSRSQQAYINNYQNDCYATNASSALGYSCNGRSKSCESYLDFKSQPQYNSPVLIAYLLAADTTNVSLLNNVSDVSAVAAGKPFVIPIPCSCSGNLYQHNASYNLQTDDTYFTVANLTYQGLTTCQALIAQNPYDSRHLPAAAKLVVPLRCACPTAAQILTGVKYLLSYIINFGDDVPTIAQRFGVESQSVLDANGLSSKSVIYPFTTLLIPLKTKPTKDQLVSPPPPPPPPASVSPASPPTDGKGGSKKWVFVGIGIGVGFLVLSGALLMLFCRRRRQRRRAKPIPPRKTMVESVEYGGLSGKPPRSGPLMSGEIRKAVEQLTVYEFEELETATGFFDDEHKLKGSVYRGVINGDDAAIKRLNGDVSDEINILRQVNHSSVIRLSGFCIHEGNTYLVYEFAEKGSLGDWLRHKKDSYGSCLSWKQRVQISYDVADGLNYLHNYVNPPYVHKDLKSSNIVLDSEFRAKVANFGLARPVGSQDGMQLTRHVVGTQGYMAPEYLEHGLISPKLDVFAFGVVMLELLSGKEAIFPKEGVVKGEVLLWTAIGDVLVGEDVRTKLRGFVDPCLRQDYPFDLAFAMAELAARCVAREPSSRPTTTEVFMSLSAIYSSTLDWDPSDVTHSGSLSHGR